MVEPRRVVVFRDRLSDFGKNFLKALGPYEAFAGFVPIHDDSQLSVMSFTGH
jgi:hypothetical protein